MKNEPTAALRGSAPHGSCIERSQPRPEKT
jgi:hypothetical protein